MEFTQLNYFRTVARLGNVSQAARELYVTQPNLSKSIRELDIRRLYGINIIAIERDHRTDVEFSPESRFQNGDTILVIGKSEKIDRFERAFQD